MSGPAEEAGAALQGLSLQEGEAGAQGQPKPTVILVIGALGGGGAATRTPPPPPTPPTLLTASLLVVVAAAGMAGSGKTTFLQRLNAHLHARSLPGCARAVAARPRPR